MVRPEGLSQYHVWNRTPGKDPYTVQAPTRRELRILFGLWLVISLFIVLVLSIGSPAHEIFPDPNFEGMLSEIGFWISVLFWGFLGSAMPLIWVKWGGKDGRNMILLLIVIFLGSYLAYDYYAPFSAALPIGFIPGVLVEMSAWYRHIRDSEPRESVKR